MLMTIVFKSTRNINLRKKRLVPITLWFTVCKLFFIQRQMLKLYLTTSEPPAVDPDDILECSLVFRTSSYRN